MKEGTNGNSVSAPKELEFEGKGLGCGTEGTQGSHPPFMAKEMQARRREGLRCDACGRPWRLEDGEITQGE